MMAGDIRGASTACHSLGQRRTGVSKEEAVILTSQEPGMGSSCHSPNYTPAAGCGLQKVGLPDSEAEKNIFLLHLTHAATDVSEM